MVALPEHGPRLPRLGEHNPAAEGSRHGGAHARAGRIPQPLHTRSIEDMFERAQQDPKDPQRSAPTAGVVGPDNAAEE